MQYAEALVVLGQRDRALALVRPLIDQLTTRLAADPEDNRVLSTLSYAQAVVGDHAAARASLERLMARLPNYPFRMQAFIRANAGIVYGWIGEKDKAVDLLESQLGTPAAATSSVIALHYDIDFFPLRGFPRWEAVLANPAHKQPFKY